MILQRKPPVTGGEASTDGIPPTGIGPHRSAIMPTAAHVRQSTARRNGTFKKQKGDMESRVASGDKKRNMMSAAKWGALVGVGSYVILIIGLTLLSSILFGASPADFSNPGPLTLACLGIFGVLFAFSAAGYFTGRETHRAGWGAISAIIALIIYYVLSLIYTPGRGSGTGSPSTSGHLSVIAQVLSAIAAAAFVLLIAAGMGWLGARPAVQQAEAKRRKQNAAPVEPEP
jgi:hypothetical protein